MNKKDLIPVIVLIALIPLWLLIDRTVIAPKMAKNHPPAVEQVQEESAEAVAEETGSAVDDGGAVAAIDASDSDVEEPAAPAIESSDELKLGEGKTVTIENDLLSIEVTERGGGIASVTLQAKNEKGEFLYPIQRKGAEPVVLDFSDVPALAYESADLGLGYASAFSVTNRVDGKSATITKEIGDFNFTRTISLDDGYLLKIIDSFVPKSEAVKSLPSMRILTGHIQNPPEMKSMKGLSLLGVDSHTPDGEIRYWGRKLNKLYKKADYPETLSGSVPDGMEGVTVDWVSAKNKFFAQILSPGKTPATMQVVSAGEKQGKRVTPTDIAAALVFDKASVKSGNAIERTYSYYVGPKSYSILKNASSDLELEGVMEFETVGFWASWKALFIGKTMEPLRKALLWSLNVFDALFHNYGLSIIFLTLVVRVLFWPLTHKSTESMKRMQELQPQIKALQAKYAKTNPQMLQQETMKLYRENKVNPMGGCLPMFLQMPVLFALFTVLRSAIELRYAGFLWIADLSSPENLFAGHIPVVGALNILPLLMSASMIWQQKMNSPASSAITPEQQQQQKMMTVMMPIMMLFFFYSMPSGLVLYWTTSNLLMIAQTAIRNMRKKMAEA